MVDGATGMAMRLLRWGAITWTMTMVLAEPLLGMAAGLFAAGMILMVLGADGLTTPNGRTH